eukprot:maker-scaffold_6-snap-gene-15.17-mRNA-1 protein AED:0.00 eAED:0.00 QI:1406/1/1/1/0/0/2/162/77
MKASCFLSCQRIVRVQPDTEMLWLMSSLILIRFLVNFEVNVYSLESSTGEVMLKTFFIWVDISWTFGVGIAFFVENG